MQANIVTHKTNWDLTLLFKSDDDPQIEQNREIVKINSYKFIDKWKNRVDYLEDIASLKEALDEYELWSRNYGANAKECYYFFLRSEQDETDPKIKAKLNKATEISTKISNDIQFFELKLSKISKEKQEEFTNHETLKDYKHYLERVFNSSKYVLSESEEKILNLLSPTSYSNWEKMTSGFLSKEEREVENEQGQRSTKSYSEIYSMLTNVKKSERISANVAIKDIYTKWLEVGENEINSILYSKKTEDELRGYQRADESRHISDDIDTEVVDSLIKSVSDHNYIAHRYYALKSKLLKQEKLEYYEKAVEYTNTSTNISSSNTLSYPYDVACNLVYKVFNNLDPKFGEISRMFIENGHVDVYSKKGKSNGAFCASDLQNAPTYVFLNFDSELREVLTIAHEFGHGINAELMKEKQNALNFNTPTSTAEVASTFMEDFVLQEILKTADEEKRFEIMVNRLNDDISTIFRQVACYIFEQELHKQYREKGYLSKEEIGQIFAKEMKAYLGDSILDSEDINIWWLGWSHIRYFFYVYSYASGLLISKSMQASVKKDPKFIEKVKTFLSSGSYLSPKDIFQNMDIDITNKSFWQTGLKEIEILLEQTEELAHKLGKI